MRISSKTESRLLVQPPSLPSPTLTPAFRSSGSRVIPSPRNMLELGQYASAAPRAPISATSASSSHTQWTPIIRGPRTPRRSR